MPRDSNRTLVNHFIIWKECERYFKFGLSLPILLEQQGFDGTVGTLEPGREKSPYNCLDIGWEPLWFTPSLQKSYSVRLAFYLYFYRVRKEDVEVTPMHFGDEDLIIQRERGTCEVQGDGQETWELSIIQRRLGLARQRFSSFNEPS